MAYLVNFRLESWLTLCFLANIAVIIMRLLITVRTVREDMMAIWEQSHTPLYSVVSEGWALALFLLHRADSVISLNAKCLIEKARKAMAPEELKKSVPTYNQTKKCTAMLFCSQYQVISPKKISVITPVNFFGEHFAQGFLEFIDFLIFYLLVI